MATKRKGTRESSEDVSTETNHYSKQKRALRKEQKQSTVEQSSSSTHWQWLLLVIVLLLAILGLYYYYYYYQPPSSSSSSSSSQSSRQHGTLKDSKVRHTGSKSVKRKQSKSSSDNPRTSPGSVDVEKKSKQSSSSSSSSSSRKTSSAPYNRKQREVKIADLRLLRRPVPPADQDRPYIIEILTGDNFLQSGDYNAALEKFNEVLGKFRQSPRAAFGKALALENLAVQKESNRMMDTAIDFYYDIAFESTLANEDLKLNALVRLATHAKNRGKLKMAIKGLKRALEMEPKNADYAIQLGSALMRDKQTDKAVEQFQKVLQQWPENAQAHANLGFLLYQGKRYEDAITHLLAVVRSKKERKQNRQYYLYAGDALTRLNRSDEAYQLYEEAARLKLFPSKWQRPLIQEPGLIARPWWTLEQTGYQSVLNTFKDQLQTIKSEVKEVIDPSTGLFKNSSEDQTVLQLYHRGVRDDNGCHLTPVTCRLLENFDEASSCTSGESKFLVLPPHLHIHPHTSPTNTILRALLPVHLTSAIVLRVGEESKEITDELVVLDDSFEQELHYHGDQPGVLLLIDMWHPDLPADKLPSL